MDTKALTLVATATAKIADGLRILGLVGWPSSPELVYRDYVRADLLGEILLENYKTNDLLTLLGGFAGRKELRINALTIELDAREFLVLLVLGRVAKWQASDKEPSQPPAFAPVDLILRKVERIRRDQPGLQSLWRYPVAEDIRKAVASVRSKIQVQKGNPNLIESGQRGDGYRLSTAPRNIEIVLVPSLSIGDADA